MKPKANLRRLEAVDTEILYVRKELQKDKDNIIARNGLENLLRERDEIINSKEN